MYINEKEISIIQNLLIFIIIILVFIIFIQVYYTTETSRLFIWTVFGNLAQAASAIGTFWAVKTTLSLAAKDEKTKLKIDLAQKDEYIEISIINVGKLPISLNEEIWIKYNNIEKVLSCDQFYPEHFLTVMKNNDYQILKCRSEYLCAVLEDMEVHYNQNIFLFLSDKESIKYFSKQVINFKEDELICIRQS